MAKVIVPNYVSAALLGERTAQIVTIAAVAVYVFGASKTDSELAELGETLHKVSPHRELKTWQNYATTVKAFVAHASVQTKMEALWSAASDPADMVTPLAQWADATLTKAGFTTALDDVKGWAKGQQSIKAKAKAAKAAAAEKVKADKAAADKAAAEKIVADKAAAEKALADALAAQQAAHDAEMAASPRDPLADATPTPHPMSVGAPAGTNSDTSASGYAPAVLGGSVLTVTREGEGFAVVHAGLSSEDLRSIAEALIAQADSIDADAVAAAILAEKTTETAEV